MTRGRLASLAALVLGAAALYLAADAVVGGLWRAFAEGADHRAAYAGAAEAPDPRDWDVLLDLSGTWAFRLGDDRAWAADAVPEAGWGTVDVPAAWEDEGYFGYDGFAWYRTTFTLDADAAKRARDEPAHLLLGRIDDVDEVWVNGVYVGRTGRTPPLYKTASFAFRTYRIPRGVLRPDGPNTVAVRVYDEGLEGGVLEGPVALAVPTPGTPAAAPLVADLSGTWRFRTGDDPAWSAPDLPEAGWDSLRVPGTWETQGVDYDGTAWYRHTVSLSAAEADQDLVLVLGLIDDLDEAFVNGVRVGGTGDVDARTIRGDEWQRERAYPVPRGALHAGENVVAVRVYDGLLDGGIYRGPVGLMTAEAHAERRAHPEAGGDIW